MVSPGCLVQADAMVQVALGMWAAAAQTELKLVSRVTALAPAVHLVVVLAENVALPGLGARVVKAVEEGAGRWSGPAAREESGSASLAAAAPL